MLEKCGFVREAVLKEGLSKEGKLYDEVVFRWVGDSEIERVPCFPPMG